MSSSNQSPGDPVFPLEPFGGPLIPSSNLGMLLINRREITVKEIATEDTQVLMARHGQSYLVTFFFPLGLVENWMGLILSSDGLAVGLYWFP